MGLKPAQNIVVKTRFFLFPLFDHFFFAPTNKKLFISIFLLTRCSFHILSILVSRYLCRSCCECARNCRVASFVLSFKTVDAQLLCIFFYFFSSSFVYQSEGYKKLVKLLLVLISGCKTEIAEENYCTNMFVWRQSKKKKKDMNYFFPLSYFLPYLL